MAEEDGIQLKSMSSQIMESRGEGPKYSLKSLDEQKLAHFGKRQQFRRNFSLLSIIGLSCGLMITWEGGLILLQSIILNGGPTGAIAAYPFVAFGVLMQALVMSEMASMIPLSGGQYNWVAILAPPAWSNFLSYMTGWVTTIAWQAASIGEAYINAVLIQALVQLNYPSYVPHPWHGTLISYALISLSVLVATMGAKIFPKVEAMTLVLHVVGFFAILITLVYLAPKNAPADVFKVFINGGGFSTGGQSWLVGTVTVMFTFIGIDAATHMAEEIEGAEAVIPQAMIISVIINGSMGFGMLIAVLFCMGPIDGIFTSEFSFPFIGIFANVTNSNGGATAMTAILLVVAISGNIGLLTTSSRMLWAFARENGVPGSSYISKVEPRTALPLYSIGISAIINFLFVLIGLGSTTALNAFTGLTVAGFYSAFMISASVMLHKRLTTPNADILWGSFKLGRAGVPITLIALAYSVVGWLFSFYPPVAQIDVMTWNWSFVVYSGTVLISLAWWFLRARHYYTGPKMELANLH